MVEYSQVEEAIKTLKLTVVKKPFSIHATEKGITVIWIVKWFDNEPTLEKRNFYLKKDEKKLSIGKAMGLNAEDVATVFSNQADIAEVIGLEKN